MLKLAIAHSLNSEATDGGFVFNTSRVSVSGYLFLQSIEFGGHRGRVESLMSRYVDGLDGSSLLAWVS